MRFLPVDSRAITTGCGGCLILDRLADIMKPSIVAGSVPRNGTPEDETHILSPATEDEIWSMRPFERNPGLRPGSNTSEVYAATQKQNVAFRLLHSNAILREYGSVPPATFPSGRRIARGYEYEKGRFVILTRRRGGSRAGLMPIKWKS